MMFKMIPLSILSPLCVLMMFHDIYFYDEPAIPFISPVVPR